MARNDRGYRQSLHAVFGADPLSRILAVRSPVIFAQFAPATHSTPDAEPAAEEYFQKGNGAASHYSAARLGDGPVYARRLARDIGGRDRLLGPRGQSKPKPRQRDSAAASTAGRQAGDHSFSAHTEWQNSPKVVKRLLEVPAGTFATVRRTAIPSEWSFPAKDASVYRIRCPHKRACVRSFLPERAPRVRRVRLRQVSLRLKWLKMRVKLQRASTNSGPITRLSPLIQLRQQSVSK